MMATSAARRRCGAAEGACRSSSLTECRVPRSCSRGERIAESVRVHIANNNRNNCTFHQEAESNNELQLVLMG
jgi:hypothetical protein